MTAAYSFLVAASEQDQRPLLGGRLPDMVTPSTR